MQLAVVFSVESQDGSSVQCVESRVQITVVFSVQSTANSSVQCAECSW